MKTIFATILHRRSVFYEEGMQKFLDAGYPLYLYVTVEDKGFGNFGLVHPLIK